MMKTMVEENAWVRIKDDRFKNETRAGIEHFQKQMAQLATSVPKLEEREGKLPSQADHNPPANIILVVTRSGATTGEELKEEKVHDPTKKGKEKDKKKN